MSCFITPLSAPSQGPDITIFYTLTIINFIYSHSQIISALLPFKYPIKDETAILGGINTNICT